MRTLWILGVLAALMMVAGCGDEFMTTDMDAATNDNGYSLTVVASPDNINITAGGTITLMISVIGPDGGGVEGAAVLMSSTMGTLGAAELTTDIDGYAATSLTPGDVNGYAVIVATYKGMQAMVEVDFWKGASGDTGA
ncbi:MAG TPA: hypothetical protein PKW95_19280 [bacterium]|nr:hypothetical protein [bacterium]